MAPVSVAGTLTQVLAEVLAGVAYSQLIRKGAPVIFGAFVTSIAMGSGAPPFGTPEAALITYGAGQLARRLNLPYRPTIFGPIIILLFFRKSGYYK